MQLAMGLRLRHPPRRGTALLHGDGKRSGAARKPGRRPIRRGLARGAVPGVPRATAERRPAGGLSRLLALPGPVLKTTAVVDAYRNGPSRPAGVSVRKTVALVPSQRKPAARLDRLEGELGCSAGDAR